MAADTHLSADHSLVREGTSRESDLIESLCTRLGQKDEAKLVLIPLEGITLTEAAVEIGAFRLRLMNDEAIAEATALWNAGIDRTTNTPDQKAIVKEWHAKQFGPICVVASALKCGCRQTLTGPKRLQSNK